MCRENGVGGVVYINSPTKIKATQNLCDSFFISKKFTPKK